MVSFFCADALIAFWFARPQRIRQALGNRTPNALTKYGFTRRELDADTGLMLPGVIAHELIHIGRPGFQPNNWFQKLFFHDLYGFSHHDRIIEACDCR